MISKLRALSMVALMLVPACKREVRVLRIEPPNASTAEGKTLSDLRPAGASAPMQVHNQYEDNAYAVSEGKRLYQAFNCNGCHFNGGGGIGPALMDDQWIYGDKPENIFASIVEGRPNGMPAFRGKIPDYEVWQIVAYVRSLSGQLAKDVAPGRSDHMQVKLGEQQVEREQAAHAAPPH